MGWHPAPTGQCLKEQVWFVLALTRETPPAKPTLLHYGRKRAQWAANYPVAKLALQTTEPKPKPRDYPRDSPWDLKQSYTAEIFLPLKTNTAFGTEHCFLVYRPEKSVHPCLFFHYQYIRQH